MGGRVLTVEQLAAPKTITASWDGEVALWWAVLDLALADLQWEHGCQAEALAALPKWVRSKGCKPCEAAAWVMDCSECVGSFAWCCALFDLSPTAVQAALARRGSQRSGVPRFPRGTATLRLGDALPEARKGRPTKESRWARH